ncbi:ABC transporter permease [Martelella mediterranea]|uniref:ABC transporter permease n=1 Tax=Martelella mediterranea TaxID=293089 RepID=UPI001E39FCAA|nr:ABC transporter permease [Martelella mediterranea]MCD1636222.1 ABC transporter permease [Martelella mediterranea]
MSAITETETSAAGRLDKLGVIVAAIALIGLFAQPFALSRANRIVSAEGVMVWAAMPMAQAIALIAFLLAVIAAILLKTPVNLRLAASIAAIAALAVMVGRSGAFLMPDDNPYARVSPGGGFWIMLFAFSIAMADAIVRKQLSPLARVAFLAAAIIAIGVLLWSGAWSALSIIMEYENRASAFWREGRTHVALAFGSLAAATAVGIPLGILCFRAPKVRASILNSLNVLQTIPSIALFGLLIAPLAWIGRTVPGAAAIGIAGIGFAPAIVALFAYSLLPVVSNTVAGLDSVPRDARDAARGMGMTGRQLLFQIELPLAFPVILTGIRIVLVQNIGLAVIAGLIGGGGFGTFVFQGIGQTATDLVLLGALPVVGMAFASAIILDALVEISQKKGDRRP